MLDLWYKNAVIYAVDIEKYADSDGDGVGDIRGLHDRLEYIATLGVTCLWLLPFHPSPRRDNGYDVVDYFGIDPRLGDIDDFQALVQRAGELGIRLMMDLVMAHTSDEHPWFRASRRDARSRYRGYYIWSDAPRTVPVGHSSAFPGEETTVWTYDAEAHSYYYHRFYAFQPQLDFGNPEVRREAYQVMDFWLAMGVAGFRVDAVPMMVGPDPAVGGYRDTHGWLRELREAVTRQQPTAALLGEVDLATHQLVEYFGEGDEMNMLFDFFLNGYLWLALAIEDCEPLIKAMRQLPAGPRTCQWVNFLRNLDELNLGWLRPEDRERVYERFAPREEMRVYERGIRRRVAPMLRDPRRAKLAWALMFSLPGTPMIVYGDELGLGEDLQAPGRDAVRPLMQWSSHRNGGFSSAAARALVRSPLDSGPFSYKRVNAEDQRGDPGSLLSFMTELIAVRRRCPEFALGEWHAFGTACRGVMAHHCIWKDGHVVAVHNLCGKPQEVEIDIRDHHVRQLLPLIGEGTERQVEEGVFSVGLDPYGFRWYRVSSRPDKEGVTLSW